MAVEGVVGDVYLAAGVPAGELRPLRVVADRVVLLVELDVEVVDELVPEPLDARGTDPGTSVVVRSMSSS